MVHQRHLPSRDGGARREASYPWDTASDVSDLTWSDGLPAFFEEAPEKRGDAEELVQRVMADLLQDGRVLVGSNERLQESVDAFYARYSAKQRTEKLQAIITRTDVRDPAKDWFAKCALWTSLASTFLCWVIFNAKGADAYDAHSAVFDGTILAESVRGRWFSFSLYFTIGTCLPMFVQESNQWISSNLLKVKGGSRNRTGGGLEQGHEQAQGLEEAEQEEAQAQAVLTWLPPLSFQLIRRLILLVILIPTIVLLWLISSPSHVVNLEAFFVVSQFWQYSAIAATGIAFFLKNAVVVPRCFLVAQFHAFNVGVIVQLWAILSSDYEQRIAPSYAVLALESIMYLFFAFKLFLALRRGDFTSPHDGMLTSAGCVVLGINVMFVLMLVFAYGMGLSIKTINFSKFSEFVCCWLVYVKTISVVGLATLTTRVANLDCDATKTKFRNMLVQEEHHHDDFQNNPVVLQGVVGVVAGGGGLEAVPSLGSIQNAAETEAASASAGPSTSPPMLCSLRWQEEVDSNAETDLA